MSFSYSPVPLDRFPYNPPVKECHFLEGEIWVHKSALSVLASNDVLSDNLVEFINALCQIVDDNSYAATRTIDNDEYAQLERCLRSIMIRYESGALYHHLLNSSDNAMNELNFAVWSHFTLDQTWDMCVRSFADMPTEMLEKYAADEAIWAERSATVGREGFNDIMAAIATRTDIYGGGNLPNDMLKEILFNPTYEEDTSSF